MTDPPSNKFTFITRIPKCRNIVMFLRLIMLDRVSTKCRMFLPLCALIIHFCFLPLFIAFSDLKYISFLLWSYEIVLKPASHTDLYLVFVSVHTCVLCICIYRLCKRYPLGCHALLQSLYCECSAIKPVGSFSSSSTLSHSCHPVHLCLGSRV